MTDPTGSPSPQVGSVAEEAARLIDAFAAMARPSGSHGGGAWGGLRQQPNAHDEPYVGPPGAQEGSPRCRGCGGASDAAANGAPAGSPPAACRICPLCQGIALLRSVRPETVDCLADLAAAVASSLRDLAAQARSAGPASRDAGDDEPGRTGRATVQDIPVDDESEGSST